MPAKSRSNRLTAIDLFCGAGGVSVGLKQAGFRVLGAVDVSELAARTYRLNHRATKVWRRNIRNLSPREVLDALGLETSDLDLLAGCPPCQGFSTMRTLKQAASVDDTRNSLIAQFGRYAEALRPRALMMENVPGLAADPRLVRLEKRLRGLGYELTKGVLDAADYEVPQRRKRFVLVGMRGRSIAFAGASARRRTVRHAIGFMIPTTISYDALHGYDEDRSPEVMARIAAIPVDGGSLHEAGDEYTLDCKRRLKGFGDVYGRMAWDTVAPTITGGCINPSKGRFIHPEENRAITLREAALLQTFPPKYRFSLDEGRYKVAELIGNALPPAFVARHAKEISRALRTSG
jgi:DNA (cytosine-5)-methyltransferase 1